MTRGLSVAALVVAWCLGAVTTWAVLRAGSAASAGITCPSGCEIDVAPVSGERLRAVCWCDTEGR